MDEESKTLAEVVRAKLKTMSNQDRVELLGELAHGYCPSCGRDVGEGFCHCENDE